MKTRFSTRTIAFGSLLISSLSLSLISLGSAFGTANEIQGCVNKKTLVLRVSGKCTKDETKIRWNVTGPQGLQGEPGLKGDTGPIGPQGEKGERGETGAKGEAGAQGAKGNTGVQGLKGDKGDTGIQGIQGPQGAKGETGSTPVLSTRQVSYIFWENVTYSQSQNWGNGPVLQPITNYSSPNCPGGTLYFAGIPSTWEIDANTQRIALSCVFSVFAP